jgi:hypothetical protein
MNRTLASLLLGLLATAACGDNLDAPDARMTGPAADAAPQPPRAVIVAGDFVPGDPGVMSAIDMTTKVVTTNVAPMGAIGEDPVLRVKGDELFVVNRASGNNVTILKASDFSLVEQLGTGAGTNPQDVAAIGDKLYVATLGNKGGVILTRGSTATTEIDLSADDPDGKPNCSSVFYANSKLFFACGLLDDTNQFLPPRGPGKIYIVNPSTGAVDGSITLTTKNPIALFEQIPAGAPKGGDLLISTIDFGTGEGCVERIVTTGTPATAGCVVNNSALGGFAFASRVAFQGNHARVAVSDYPKGNVRDYDLAAAALDTAAMTAMAQVISDVAICPGGEMVVADNPPPPSTAPNGVRIYMDAAEKTTDALPIGLKPASSHGLVCY